MKKGQLILFCIGAILLLVGIISFSTSWFWAPYLYALGASMVAVVQLSDHYYGTNQIIKRLRTQQIFGAILLVLTSVFMFSSHGNEWIVCLSIAAVFEIYVAFRIPQELAKEDKNKSESLHKK